MTVEDYQTYRRFLLLELFHIRPWEYNGGIVYPEDLADMIRLKGLQNAAEKDQMDKAQWRSEVQGRLSNKWG